MDSLPSTRSEAHVGDRAVDRVVNLTLIVRLAALLVEADKDFNPIIVRPLLKPSDCNPCLMQDNRELSVEHRVNWPQYR